MIKVIEKIKIILGIELFVAGLYSLLVTPITPILLLSSIMLFMILLMHNYLSKEKSKIIIGFNLFIFVLESVVAVSYFQ